MKLLAFQIEHIKEWIQLQNIWYNDLKDELLDHMICATEEKMANQDLNFVEALAQVCTEVEPRKIQRQKLHHEHLNTLKSSLYQMTMLKIGKVVTLFIALLLYFSALYWGGTAQDILDIYMSAAVLIVLIVSMLYTYRLRSKNPLANLYIMSKLNAVSSSSFLFVALSNLLFSDWIIQNEIALLAFIGVSSWWMITGSDVLFQSYKKIRYAAQ